MIDSLKIINLPHGGQANKPLGIQVGDTIHLDGENLLITGENGIGKTTFLTALRDSLQRNNEFLRGVDSSKRNPYSAFADQFNGQYLRMTGQLDEDQGERGRISYEEILGALETAFKDYFGGNIVHLFHNGIPTGSLAQVLYQITIIPVIPE